MVYNLSWVPEAEEDFDDLNHSVQILANKQFKKLAKSPELVEKLGNKQGIDLSLYRKKYFNKKKHRIIYLWEPGMKEVIIFAIGPREDMNVYRTMLKR